MNYFWFHDSYRLDILSWLRYGMDRWFTRWGSPPRQEMLRGVPTGNGTTEKSFSLGEGLRRRRDNAGICQVQEDDVNRVPSYRLSMGIGPKARNGTVARVKQAYYGISRTTGNLLERQAER
jgi:hypothetical protein